MPLTEYYDELAEQALGWLGWTEAEAMASDVNAIVVGMRGKVAMLKAVFGGGEEGTDVPAKQATSARPLTPALFGALFPARDRMGVTNDRAVAG